jgi:signal transduction histidine kinase
VAGRRWRLGRGNRARALLHRAGSVRARATIVALVIVGAAMALGAVGLLALLRSSMTEGVETTVRAQVADVAALVRLGQLPAQLPAGRGGTFTQVVGPDGKVVASTASLLGTEPISRTQPGEDGAVIRTIPTLSDRASDSANDSEGPYLLLAQTVPAAEVGGGGARPVTVYVAGSLHPVNEATATVGIALAVGLPVLVILVGGLVWIFAGRALRPVEAIRAEVADISGHDLHRRVPEPASADEVARLARTMNEMLDRLDGSAAAQRRFVADASHELRSPLAVLQATLEVALAHPDRESWPAVASDALEETRRLQRLVEDLLVLARVDEPGGAPHREPVDLDEIVMREGHLRRATGEVSLDLHRVSGGRVSGDPDQLARVVHNLLDNAARHAAHQVTVELSASGDTVTLVVADDGPGVPPEQRAEIFERFARLDEARSQDAGGTGLGLAIVKEIIEAHGGRIEVLDAPAGARFAVILPAADGTAEPPGPNGGGSRLGETAIRARR